MSRVIRVFVSYSRHDQEADRVLALLEWLQELAGKQIDFVLDSRFGPGTNVRKLEESIRHYPCILILGTTGYKKKVLEGPDSGVAREHNIIVSMMKQKTIDVFLAVMEATFADVFPETLHEPLATNFSGLFHDSASKRIPHQTRLRYAQTANALITAILESNPDPKKNQGVTDEIRTKLFFEQKQELVSPYLSDEDFEDIFVKTSFYDAVVKRGAHLLIGRKGSGKSFLTEYFTRVPMDERTIPINVHFRDFRLINIYLMRSTSRLEPDIGGLVQQKDLFEAAWCLFFVASAVLMALVRVKSGELEGAFHKIGEMDAFAEKCGCLDVASDTGQLVLSSQRLIDWCTEKVFHTVDAGFSNVAGDYARAVASLQSLVKPSKIIPAVIGAPTLKEFNLLVNRADPVFLLTVDGFDTKFDAFRRETNREIYEKDGRRKRVQFEIDWLSGLIEAAQQVVNRGNSPAFTAAAYRMLITLPHDRFEEVLREDRDSFRLRFRHVEIRWSGIELMNLVRKRLEKFYQRKCAEEKIVERFFESLDWVCQIPRHFRFEYNGKPVEIDVFSYLLRHSFWRPRDILYHVAELISLSDKFGKRGRPVTFEQIRHITKKAARDIIEQEFIGEFSSIFPTIASCVSEFKRSKIEMDFDTLYGKLELVKFRLSSGESLNDTFEKIDFLFEIGFLGIVLPPELRDHVISARREAFSFSDSIQFYRGLDEVNKRVARWVIHPIFTEYLQLDTEASPFLLQYDIEYLVAGD
jgi:hypothetical protein